MDAISLVFITGSVFCDDAMLYALCVFLSKDEAGAEKNRGADAGRGLAGNGFPIFYQQAAISNWLLTFSPQLKIITYLNYWGKIIAS